MTRATTFIPQSRGGDDHSLSYVEESSRHRTIHVLLQDCAVAPSASRERFLRESYREIVARYLTFGKIEHPLPFLRELTRVLDRLARRVDSRVDDFAGLGVYILVQDGMTLYALASRDGSVLLEREGEPLPVDRPDLEGVRPVPLESRRAQQELFGRTARDFLALYCIDVSDGGMTLTIGGTPSDHEAVDEARAAAGVVVAPGTTVAAGVRHRVVSVRAAPPPRVRDAILPAPARRRRRSPATFVAAAAVILVAAVGLTWLGGRLTRPQPERADLASRDTVAGDEASSIAAQEAASPHRPAVEPVASEQSAPVTGAPAAGASEAGEASAGEAAAEAPADGPQPALALVWRREIGQPVTTTPAVAGGMVYFGARDGRLRAARAGSGKTVWTYEGVGGVGASPVVVGGSVVGADYGGTVFRLDAETGKPQWRHRLPQKVVSTPCVAAGEVVVGCLNARVYGLSLETGRRLWTVRTGGRVRGSAAAHGGHVFIASHDGKLYAIAQGAGHVRWTARLGGPTSSSPAVSGNRVIAGGPRGLTAFDATNGKVLWRLATPKPVNGFVAVDAGRAAAGCDDGAVYCVNVASGKRLWKAPTGGTVLARPLFRDGAVLVASYDGALYRLNAESGAVVARYDVGSPVFSSPVSAGEQVFFGTNGGALVCLSLGASR